jgi:tRNA(Ile)-lysidine synthase
VDVIHLSCPVPHSITVACSGGIDSMVALDFFMKGKKNIKVAYFDHGTPHGKVAKRFVESFCREYGIEFLESCVTRQKMEDESPEEYWRNERVSWLHSLLGPVVTAHHLDDAVEWWIFSSLNGISRLIPSTNRNIIRPFLWAPKSEIIRWANKNKIPYVEDESNSNLRYARNRIRHNILPEALKINPGLYKVVKKKLQENSQFGGDKPVC